MLETTINNDVDGLSDYPHPEIDTKYIYKPQPRDEEFYQQLGATILKCQPRDRGFSTGIPYASADSHDATDWMVDAQSKSHPLAAIEAFWQRITSKHDNAEKQ